MFNFPLMDNAFIDVSKKTFLKLKSEVFSPMFCSRNLVISFSFRQWSIYVNDQQTDHRKVSFTYLWPVVSAPFVEKTTLFFTKLPLNFRWINWPWMCGSISHLYFDNYDDLNAIPHCFADCKFVKVLKWDNVFFDFILLNVVLAMLGPLHSYMNFLRINLLIYTQNISEISTKHSYKKLKKA